MWKWSFRDLFATKPSASPAVALEEPVLVSTPDEFEREDDTNEDWDDDYEEEDDWYEDDEDEDDEDEWDEDWDDEITFTLVGEDPDLVKVEYEHLSAGDMLQKGDEFCSVFGRWVETSAAGGPIAPSNDLKYRRPIITKYRYLEPGERVEKGDEFKDPYSGEWAMSFNFDHGGQATHMRKPVPYRRPLPAEVKPVPPAEPAIDPGEGYRLLAKDELVEESNEYFTTGIWWASNNWITDDGKQCDYTYRRRVTPQPKPEPTIDPGKGYRLLAKDELVEEGDEYFSPSADEWITSVNWRMHDGQQSPVGHSYRRRVTPQPKPEPTIDPGEGYRLLAKNELVEEGDEYLCVGIWFTSHNAVTNEGKQCSVFPYRRRVTAQPKPEPAIDPGEGYRLLAVGETILPSDEVQAVWDPYKVWSETICGGYTHTEPRLLRYRRKIKPAPDQYVWLYPGDVLQNDDEYERPIGSGKFVQTIAMGHKVQEFKRYRRRITANCPKA